MLTALAQETRSRMTKIELTPHNDRSEPTGAREAQILDELPEIAAIRDDDLRRKVVAAWIMALDASSFSSIREIQPAGNPDVLVLKHGDQTDHIRGVTRLAMKIADDFMENFPELPIDPDIVVAGGLCHDIGKCWEFDPERRKKWLANPGKAGRPSIRHPAYGVHICLSVGLPEEVAHIAAAHSGEGELLVRSLENTIIHHADHTYWYVLLAGGMIEPESVPAKDRR
jgi:putative nucleotidyltransferase with HDIG domain